MTTGILLLAAGSSRRFGSDKRLAPMEDGRSLLEHSLGNALNSGLPVNVCLSPGDNALADRVREAGATALICCESHGGMGATLAEGVQQLRDWDGVLIALADMPWIEPAIYRQVEALLTDSNIVQPTYQGEPGHPVGFGRRFFDVLAELDGDSGGREVIAANADALIRVAIDLQGIVRDVDLPAELRCTERK